MRKFILTALLALATTAGASAQKFLEYGVKAGIGIPDFSTKMEASEIKSKLGWHAGVVLRINTPIVGIQPELLYVRQALDLKQGGDVDLRVKSNSLSMPVLASFRVLRILHLNAGPVFSLANSCKYKFEGEKYDFGRVQPTVGYAVGAAVKLSNLLIDARFNGQFKKMESAVTHPCVENVNIRTYSVAFSLGYLF